MDKPLRFSVLGLLVVATMAALAIGWLAAARRWTTERNALLRLISEPAAPNDHALRSQPITITISHVGDFSRGHSWYLTVNPGGDALLIVRRIQEELRQSFFVPENQLNALRELLVSERFFELPPEIGDMVPDGSTRTITIIVGDDVKTVRIHFLMNWLNDPNQRGELVETARAVRVWEKIRNWFENPEPADTRSFDRRILAIVESSSGD